MHRDKLVTYLDDYLTVDEISDYGPQGLQVETDNVNIHRIALAVDVAPPVLEAAAEWDADMLLVHHGLFWGPAERIAGPLGKRVRLMMTHGINLYAAHLPLDAHQQVGNNAVLARMFGLNEISWWFDPKGTPLAVHGRIDTRPLSDLVQDVNEKLNTEAQVLAQGPEQVRNVAILSGAGAGQVAAAKALGADTFITGETNHAQYWHAYDYGMNVIFAGHYATETVGVQALGKFLAGRFDLESRFFDFPTQM